MRNEAPDGPPPGVNGRLHELNALIVADDASERAAISGALAKEGLRVTEAADGLAAALAGPLTAYDVALIDVSRPESDGMTLLRSFLRGSPRTRTVALAGPEATGRLDDALEAGADAVARSAGEANLLLAAVRSALDRDAGSRPTPPPEHGAILAASLDARLLHELQSVCTLCGWVFVPVPSATLATELLAESKFTFVVVDEDLADGPGACLVESLPLYSRTPQAILVANRSTAEELRRGRPSYVVAVESRPEAATALKRIIGRA